MIFPEKKLLLRDSREATLRSPRASDAVEMMAYIKTCAAETDFILRYPEECTETEEQEARFLEDILSSDTTLMIVCEVDGEVAGNCQLQFHSRLKTRHRATVAIAIVRKCWGLGIGTALFTEMISAAREKGVLQLELDYVEGNERARHLYEKMGFVQVAERPNAIRLRDGTMLREFSMVKPL